LARGFVDVDLILADPFPCYSLLVNKLLRRHELHHLGSGFVIAITSIAYGRGETYISEDHWPVITY
jgi:hypothetical protein